jgi:peptidoglycan/LPS O-acetylase OafA/YrhL
LIPYWVAIGIAWLDRAIPNWLLDHDNPLPDPWEFLAMLLCVQNLFGVGDLNFAHWSLTILIQSYFLWAVAFWTARRCYLVSGREDYHQRTEDTLRWLLFLATLVSLVVVISGGPGLAGWLPNLPYLALGVLVYSSAKTGHGTRMLLVLMVGVFILGCVTQASRPFMAIISAGIILALVRGFHFPECAVVRGLRYFGKRSYSIYLIHGTVGTRVLNLANHIEMSPLMAIVLFVLAVAASLVCAILFYRFVEEPLSHRVSRIEYRR